MNPIPLQGIHSNSLNTNLLNIPINNNIITDNSMDNNINLFLNGKNNTNFNYPNKDMICYNNDQLNTERLDISNIQFQENLNSNNIPQSIVKSNLKIDEPFVRNFHNKNKNNYICFENLFN